MKQARIVQSNNYSPRMLDLLLSRLAGGGWETKAVIQEGRHAGLLLMEREVTIEDAPEEKE